MWVVIWIGVQFLFTAVTGVAGINGMTPKRFWPFWPFIVVCVALSGTAVWVAEVQQRESDSRYDGIHGQLSGVQTRLGDQKTALQNLTAQNEKLQGAISKLGNAARIPAGASLDELVLGIIGKLPKTNVTIKGNGNATAVGGGQAAQQQTINAANGIGAIGGTLINPQVNNFGPPPAKLTFSEKVISQSDDKKVMEIHVSTDRAIAAASVGFILTGPFNTSDEYWKSHPPRISGGTITSIEWGIGLENRETKAKVPFSFVVRVSLPAALTPDRDLVITLESDTNTHVAQIGQM
jgi:hypothetical protein